jgi:SAM-dependent methyltransferase
MTTQADLERRAASERAFFAGWTCHPYGDERRWRRELALLRRARPKGLGDVLSLGCGRGWFEIMLSEHADRVLGVDSSPESIEAARHRSEREGTTNVDFECADVTQLCLDRRFDMVVCEGFLHHLTDSEGLTLLRRIRDHLRPGGLLHTQDPNAQGILRRLGRVALGSRYDAFHTADERELTPESVGRLFRDAGFPEYEICYMDFFLIPGMQLFPRAPGGLMTIFDWVDRVLCALPTARLASGFVVEATR